MDDNGQASSGDIVMLPCSGGSNVGQLANHAAVELTQAGFGKMGCLAGIGGKLSEFIQSVQNADRLIVIDGCDLACGKSVLQAAGVPLKTHLMVTELGIEKNESFNLSQEDIDLIKEAVKIAFIEPPSLSDMPRMSGGGGCCCRG